MKKNTAGFDIVLGQGAVCPDGYGHVIDFCFDPPYHWIQVKTLVDDRSCKWDMHKVQLVKLDTHSLKIHKKENQDSENGKEIARVGINICNCHPDTCGCPDWAVYVGTINHSTHFKKEVAQLVANALNKGIEV